MRTTLRGGQVFDARGGTVERADVAIDDGRIVDVGSGLDADVAIDVSGRTILPGLIDCHVHVMLPHVAAMKLAQTPFSYRFYQAAENLRRTLAVGITTVRDAHGADLGIKKALEDGLIPGPKMLISIGMISQTGGHNDHRWSSGANLPLFPLHPGVPNTVVDGPEDIRKLVRELIRLGADTIKVATSGGTLSPSDRADVAQFMEDELSVLVRTAAASDIPVMAHAQATKGIKSAIRAGVRSIEHGLFLDEEAAALMVERGTFLVPTLTVGRANLEAVEAGEWSLPDVMLDKLRDATRARRASFELALDAGVSIAMGTDAGALPHGTNLRELEIMSEFGMPPHDVLRSATIRAAELLRLEDQVGTVEPGKRADLVVIDGDPFDLRSLQDRITDIFQGGRRIEV